MILFNRKFIYVFLIFLAILIFHYVGILSPLENLAVKILNYPLKIGSEIGSSVAAFFDNFKNNLEFRRENMMLKEKIIDLEQKVVELETILKEKEILDEELEFLSAKDYSFVAAKVVARGVDENENIFVINRGLKHGVKKGLVVLVSDGLVAGKVLRAYDELAQVLLLNDSASEISTAALDDNSLIGVVRGDLNLSLKLEFIPKEKELKIGDLVVTSGVDEKIPAGLLIGEVRQIYEDERELFKTAQIWQLLDINNYNIVTVILP